MLQHITITVKEKDPLIKLIAQKIDKLNEKDVYVELIYSDTTTLSCDNPSIFVDDSKAIKKFLETGVIDLPQEEDLKTIQNRKLKENDSRKNKMVTSSMKSKNKDFPSESPDPKNDPAPSGRGALGDMDKAFMDSMTYKPRVSIMDGF